MSAEQRFAVWRETMRGPVYLGDVLAVDRAAAERRGAQLYGGAVMAHRSSSSPTPVSPALERALARLASPQGVTKRDRRPRS